MYKRCRFGEVNEPLPGPLIPCGPIDGYKQASEYEVVFEGHVEVCNCHLLLLGEVC